MRIALAQLDSQLGDVDANEPRVWEIVARARAGCADLVVFPELQRSGYALGGVEHDTSATAVSAAAVVDGVAALVGFHERDGERRYNSAVYVEGGAPLHVHRKLYLVDYPPLDGGALLNRRDDACVRHGARSLRRAALQRRVAAVPARARRRGRRGDPARSGGELDGRPGGGGVLAGPDPLLRPDARVLCRVREPRWGRGRIHLLGRLHIVDPLGDVVAEAPALEGSLLLVDVDVDLSRVAARRRELPLVTGLRPHVFCAELERLARRRMG